MKTYKGTAKVKDDSTYVYKGHTLEITGIYIDYKNGKGVGIYADGTREYKLNLKGTEFHGKYGTMTVIHDSHLEDIELYETIELPLSEEETLALIDYTTNFIHLDSPQILAGFIQANTKKSVLPIPDLTSLYSDKEWEKQNKQIKL